MKIHATSRKVTQPLLALPNVVGFDSHFVHHQQFFIRPKSNHCLALSVSQSVSQTLSPFFEFCSIFWICQRCHIDFFKFVTWICQNLYMDFCYMVIALLALLILLQYCIIEARKKIRKTSISKNTNTATSKYKYTCWQTWLYNYGELLICASSQSDWQILTWPEMLTQEFLQQFNIGFIRPGKILRPFTKFIVDIHFWPVIKIRIVALVNVMVLSFTESVLTKALFQRKRL